LAGADTRSHGSVVTSTSPALIKRYSSACEKWVKGAWSLVVMNICRAPRGDHSWTSPVDIAVSLTAMVLTLGGTLVYVLTITTSLMAPRRHKSNEAYVVRSRERRVAGQHCVKCRTQAPEVDGLWSNQPYNHQTSSYIIPS
jgi:hypothetical protein